MPNFADELIASLEQAAAHAGGRKVKGMRITRVAQQRRVRAKRSPAAGKPTRRRAKTPRP